MEDKEGSAPPEPQPLQPGDHFNARVLAFDLLHRQTGEVQDTANKLLGQLKSLYYTLMLLHQMGLISEAETVAGRDRLAGCARGNIETGRHMHDIYNFVEAQIKEEQAALATPLQDEEWPSLLNDGEEGRPM